MDPFSVDAYTPAEIARRLEKNSMSKKGGSLMIRGLLAQTDNWNHNGGI